MEKKELTQEKISIYEKLSRIQNEMKVPKNLYNKFGGYKYRNTETILETAKPICLKYRCTLTIDDEIVMIGERYYVKAIARIRDWDSSIYIQNSAYAREALTKKGMDDSQITGATSSYARKYALNGLFNIDDTKDEDTEELHKEKNAKANKKSPDELIVACTKSLSTITEMGVDVRSDKFLQHLNKTTGLSNVDVSEKSPDELETLLKYLNAIIKKKK